jgi:hypothetical protein
MWSNEFVYGNIGTTELNLVDALFNRIIGFFHNFEGVDAVISYAFG